MRSHPSAASFLEAFRSCSCDVAALETLRMAEVKSSRALATRPAGKRPKKPKKTPRVRSAHLYLHPRFHPEVASVMGLLRQARLVKHPGSLREDSWEFLEKKASPLDEKLLATARSVLSPGKEYHFRVVSGPTDTAVSSNATAGNTNFTPLGTAEWSGLIDALFDEYRVDMVRVTYTPVILSGATARFDYGVFVVASDYDNIVTPSSHTQVLTYNDGTIYPAMMESASSYFISNSRCHVHTSHIPREVAVAGSVATVEWLGTGDAWPGGQPFYATTTGTNGVRTMSRFTEYFVRLRMRK